MSCTCPPLPPRMSPPGLQKEETRLSKSCKHWSQVRQAGVAGEEIFLPGTKLKTRCVTQLFGYSSNFSSKKRFFWIKCFMLCIERLIVRKTTTHQDTRKFKYLNQYLILKVKKIISKWTHEMSNKILETRDAFNFIWLPLKYSLLYIWWKHTIFLLLKWSIRSREICIGIAVSIILYGGWFYLDVIRIQISSIIIIIIYLITILFPCTSYCIL